VLYTQARFLARIAAVEFRGEEAQLGRYSYTALRRTEPAARRTAARTRPTTVQT
jgi:hypothetical protein